MEINKKQVLVLASQSPRRKELLGHTFLPFEVDPSDVEEITDKTIPSEVAIQLAEMKAEAVFEKRKSNNEIVIGSDTIVVLKNEILGKPIDKSDARKMLLKLSGCTHEVITGVSLINSEKSFSFYESTKVTFRDISEDLLERYLETGDSLDKAGAYGIQNQSLSFIEKVEGSYSNVVGFPVDRFLIELKSFLDAGNDDKGIWREIFY